MAYEVSVLFSNNTAKSVSRFHKQNLGTIIATEMLLRSLVFALTSTSKKRSKIYKKYLTVYYLTVYKKYFLRNQSKRLAKL